MEQVPSERKPERELSVAAPGGVVLSGERAGEGIPVVLLHGLTATRRYVVMGSRALERSEHLVVSYDARGHGASTPAPTPAPEPGGEPISHAAGEAAYGYERLAADLEAVLDAVELDRAVLAGASMGAQTALRFALAHPERVAGLVLVTPAFDPDASRDEDELARWDALARGLREGGVEGFVRAYDLAAVPEAWRETVAKVLRQRLSAQEHPLAVADALEAVPRSRPFERIEELAVLRAPTVVVASRDEADPGHPLAVAERYVAAIAGARLAVEDAGSSPLAWQGGQLSRVIAELAAQAASVPQP